MNAIDGQGEPITIILNNVLYVPGISRNLISVTQLVLEGGSIMFTAKAATIITPGPDAREIPLHKSGTMWILPFVGHSVNAVIPESNSLNLDQWHRVMGHINHRYVMQLPSLVTGMKLLKAPGSKCTPCNVGKMKITPFPSTSPRAKYFLQRVFADTNGPHRTPDKFTDAIYVVAFLDDFSRLVKLYLSKEKSQGFNLFKQFCADIGNPAKLTIEDSKKLTTKTGRFQVETLRTDRGGEFTSNAFFEFCRDNGIKRELSIAGAHGQTGAVERVWLTLFDMARAMMAYAQLTDEFWGRAVLTACYLRNRSISRANGPPITIYELATGRKPDFRQLHTFGCRVIYCNEDTERAKTSPRGLHGIFVGYSEESKGWMVWNPATDQLKTTRNVCFFEDETIIHLRSQPPAPPIEAAHETLPPTSNLPVTPPVNLPTSKSEVTESAESNPPTSESTTTPPEAEPQLGRGHRNRVKSKKYNPEEYELDFDEPAAYQAILSNIIHNCVVFMTQAPTDFPRTPLSYKQASTTVEWAMAMKEEYQAMVSNGVWITADLPPGRKAIGCKWTFKLKLNADGTISRYKARLVAQGFTQTKGIDYDDTFAPVVKFDTLRTLISVAAKEGYQLIHDDIVTAFLHAPVDEEIYMRQPEGFEQPGEGGVKVLKLCKSIYGLKQSSRNWNLFLHGFLVSLGFEQSQADTCLYVHSRCDVYLAVAIYVDDMLFIVGCLEFYNQIHTAIAKKIKIACLGRAEFILGMHISYTDKAIHLHQAKYIDELRIKFLGSNELKPVDTPAVVRPSPSAESSQPYPDLAEYKSLVGSLIYLAVVTRPDIAFAVYKCAQTMAGPTIADWNAAKRILRYLSTRATWGPTYSGSQPLHGYSDADWAGDMETRRSTTGYVFLNNGAAISWNSRKQRSIALSTTEAEYVAGSIACQDAIHLRHLLQDLRQPVSTPTTIFGDNQGAIALAKHNNVNARSKHIDIRYHFIRETIANGHVEWTYTPTETMIADCLTKATPIQVHTSCIDAILGIKH
eukprot:TRINITY_DN1309_c0_g2_i1.p1 TRINITY_DN1309_c0_g2~~TRINITY_DN1309_c0_g2_i1.p1  ORF type:complete len:1074 (-),score=203.85 TRINITY_DN1309_c0_g2_i1:206-3268(-)